MQSYLSRGYSTEKARELTEEWVTVPGTKGLSGIVPGEKNVRIFAVQCFHIENKIKKTALQFWFYKSKAVLFI